MQQYFRASSEYFTLLLCIISTWVIAGAIPFFSLGGMYGQVDTQIFFLHSFCSFLCFFQFFKSMLYENEIGRLNNTLILVPLALAFLGILSALLNNNSLITLTGSPQIGQGVFWYLDLAIMTYVFSGILQKKSFRIVILINLIILTSITTVFTINPFWKNLPISFFYFNDYLCFFGVLNFIILTTITKNKFLIGVAYVFLGLYLYRLDNNAAIALWLCSMLLALTLTILDYFKEIEIARKLRTILGSNFAFTSYVVLLSLLIIFLAFIFWKGEGALSTEATSNPLVSAVVRGKIAQISMLSLLDVKNFFLGAGWGRVHDLLLGNMNVWQYDQLTVGFNLHFHTHNELFEHFVSLGIFGLLLFIILIYKIFDASNVVSVYTKVGWLLFFLISCFWFFWAGTLPLIALAIASLIAMEQKKNPINIELAQNKKYLLSFCTLGVGFFLLYGAWLTFSYTKEFKKISFGGLNELVENQSKENVVCENYYDDKRGGFTLIPFMNGFPSYIIRNQLPFTEQDLKIIEAVQCLAQSSIRKGQASLDLISASVLMDSKLYFSGNENAKNLFKLTKKYEQLKERALILVKRAPSRGDLIIPYISLALEKQKLEDAMLFCKNKEIKGIESLCFLVSAAYLLKKNNISSEEISKSVEYLRLAKKAGLYDEKVYGWWFSEEVSKVEGYNLKSGVPISADIMFLISNIEMENIENLLNN